MSKSTITAEILSRKFAALVLAELSEGQKALLLGHSKEDECCLSHDFIDPNQTMLDAYEQLTGYDDLDVQDDDHLNLINTAWTLARVNDWWTV